jgi:hypothetical protein
VRTPTRWGGTHPAECHAVGTGATRIGTGWKRRNRSGSVIVGSVGAMDNRDVGIAPNEPVVLRTWAVGRYSLFGSLLPNYFLVAGVAMIGVGVALFVTNRMGTQRFFSIWFVGVGLIAITAGKLQISNVAKRVDALSGGSYRFSSRKRSLVVEPSQIVSLRGFGSFNDAWGAYPFRMKTELGSMFVDRHMREGGSLESALKQANPRIVVKRAWRRNPRW